jgi:alpha-D-ribose 1-methylphosphonate 5-triphosphate diphosphatase PhnM
MMFKARPINIHPFASTFTGNFLQPRALAAIGAADRGEIVVGNGVDLMPLRIEDGIPIVLAAWREGLRII